MNLDKKRAELVKKFNITSVTTNKAKNKIQTKLAKLQKNIEAYAQQEINKLGLNITALEVIPEIVDRKPTGNALDVIQHNTTSIVEKVTLQDKETGKTREGYILGVTMSTYWNPKKHIVTEVFCNELDDEQENARNKAKFKELQESKPLATIECDFRTIA